MTQQLSPIMARRVLASELRRLRAQAQMTQQQAEQGANLGRASLSRYESCVSSISVPAAESLLRLYGVEGDRLAGLVELARHARRRVRMPEIRNVWSPMDELVALERDASTVRELTLHVIPGYLQTEQYARAALQAGRIGVEVEKKVQARMSRAALLDSDQPPQLWVVIHEGALRCQVGGREVMHEQLKHLSEMAQRPNVTVQVLPDAHGAHPSMVTPFILLEFAIAPDFAVVYMDYLTGSLYRDDQEEVDQYRTAFEHLIKVALPESQSLQMITATAKDFYS